MAFDSTATHYWRIYRSLTNDFATATLIDEKSDQSLTYRDTDIIVGETYYYWITAVDREGNESAPSPPADAGVQVYYINQESPFVWDTVPEAEMPVADGAFGYVGAITELDHCDVIDAWTTDSAVDGSVVISVDPTTFKEGAGSIKVEVWRHPKCNVANSGGTLYFEAGTDETTCGDVAAKEYVVQSFTTVNAIDVTAIAVQVKRILTPNALSCHIYSDNANKPNASLGSANVSDISPNYSAEPVAYKYAVFGAPIALAAATRYWIVLHVVGGVDPAEYYKLKYKATGDGYAGEKYGYGAVETNPTFVAAADLNFRVCIAGDALNKHIYNIIGAKDLTGFTHFNSWIRSTAIGNKISHSFGEAAIGEQNVAITVISPNAWEWKSSDISAVADADKNAVTQVGIKITNIDADRFYWIDYIVSGTDIPTLRLQRGTALEYVPTQQDAWRFPPHESQHRHLQVYNNATHWDHQVDVVWWDLNLVHDTEHWPVSIPWDYSTAKTVTVDIEVAGLGGLDTGAEAASTWYYIHVIAKDDGGATYNVILSLSATDPTMPAGYVFRACVGAVYNLSTSNFRKFYQRDRHVGCESVQVLTAGTQTAATAISLTTACPPNLVSKVSGLAYATCTATIAQISVYTYYLTTAECLNIIGNSSSTNSIIGTWLAIPNASNQVHYDVSGDASASGNVFVTGFELQI